MTAIPVDLVVENRKPLVLLDAAARWLLVIALLIVAVLAVVFLLLAIPVNDDLIRATQPMKLGWWPYFKLTYMFWQGRWSAFGIESTLLPLGDVTRLYKALLGGVVIVNLLAVLIVCRFFTASGSWRFSAAVAAGFAGLIWALVPSVAQSMYWFTGAIENVMVLSLAAMLLAGLVRSRATIPWMIFVFICTVFTCGLHELFGAMFCVALALGTCAAWRMRSANRKVWLVALIAGAIGFAIVIAAPGNQVRMKVDGPKHPMHLIDAAKLAAAQFWHWGRIWTFDPKLVAASLWVVFSPRLETSRPIWTGAAKVPWRLLVPLSWLAMLGIGFLVPSYALGRIMEPRTLSGNFVVFAVGWLVTIFIWTRRLDQRESADASAASLRSPSGSGVARLILALSLVLVGNTIAGIQALANGTVLRWHASVEERYALLRAPGPDARVIPPLAAPNWLVLGGEITSDPDNWVNVPVADFFGLKSVRLPPNATTAPADAGSRWQEH